jgi:anti-sigma factor RsiW
VSAAPRVIDDALLHGCADDRLEPEQRRLVAEWLEAHPEDARRVAAWRRQNDLIRELWGGVDGEPVPPRLSLPHLIGRPSRRRALAAAVALGLLAAGGLGGWLARGWSGTGAGTLAALAHDALAAHRLFVAERRHAVEVDRSEEQHLVTWLSRRLERPLRAPDLSAFGLTLMGGRLLPIGAGDPAAQLMYEDDAGARYTLFVTRGDGRPEEFRIVEEDGVTAFYWVDALLGCAVVGTAPRDRLLAIARAAYAQLAAPGD